MTKKDVRNVLSALMFTTVFFTLMSVSFLVEAHDLPLDSGMGSVQESEWEIEILDTLSLRNVATGVASWYGKEFHGRRTASGRLYNMNDLTAAHRSLPFGTLVRVQNRSTGKTIMVEVTDRGPFVGNRVIDLSFAAARDLGVSLTRVSLEALRPADIVKFYSNNDSTLMVFDIEGNITERRRVTVESFPDEGMTFTRALRLLDDASVVVILPPVDDKRRSVPDYVVVPIATNTSGLAGTLPFVPNALQ